MDAKEKQRTLVLLLGGLTAVADPDEALEIALALAIGVAAVVAKRLGHVDGGESHVVGMVRDLYDIAGADGVKFS